MATGCRKKKERNQGSLWFAAQKTTDLSFLFFIFFKDLFSRERERERDSREHLSGGRGEQKKKEGEIQPKYTLSMVRLHHNPEIKTQAKTKSWMLSDCATDLSLIIVSLIILKVKCIYPRRWIGILYFSLENLKLPDINIIIAIVGVMLVKDSLMILKEI